MECDNKRAPKVLQLLLLPLQVNYSEALNLMADDLAPRQVRNESLAGNSETAWGLLAARFGA